MKKIKTITSYTGLARFLAGVSEEPVAYLARAQVAHIPSPYRYSPTVGIYAMGEKLIVWFEVSHKRYQVYEVPAELMRFKTEEEASDWKNVMRCARRLAKARKW